MTEPFFDLFEAARRISEAVTLEDAVFDLYGRAAQLVTPAQLAVALAVASRNHGELSRSFALRLPVSASIPLDQFDDASTPLGRHAIGAITAAAEAVHDLESFLHLLGTEVLPALEAVYIDAFERSTPHADGPFRVILDRALEAIEADRILFSEVHFTR